ncbi:MAG: extracellular solute-binding protein [Arthrobacter sp.]
MRTKAIATASVLTAVALGLSACGTSTESASANQAAAASAIDKCKPAETTIKLAFAPQGTPAVEHAKTVMEQKFPGLKIDAVASQSSNYSDLTKQIVADSAAGKRPDLIMTGLGQLRFWTDTYNPAPIDPATLPEGYQKQFLSAGKVGDKSYLAPFQISTPVMLVNKKLLADAGITDPASIKNFGQVVEAAKKVTEKTGKPSINIASDDLPDWFSQALVQSSGEKFVADDGSFGFDTNKGREAMGLISTLAKEKLALNVKMDDGQAQFVAGNLAFQMATTSRIAQIVKNAPKDLDWTPIDLPGLNGPEGALPAGGNGWVVISEDSCKAAFSQAMVTEMLTKDASLLSSGKDYSYIPVNKLATEELLKGDNIAPQMRYAWTYDKPLTVWSGFAGAQTAPIVDTLRTMLQQMAAGKSADDSVPAAAKTINALLGK